MKREEKPLIWLHGERAVGAEFDFMIPDTGGGI